MKKTTFIFLLCATFALFANKVNAQDGYTYTLIQDPMNVYDFTVQAVPNASSNNFATSVQSYGFTIILPDGVTIDISGDTSLGGAVSASFFDGNNFSQPTLDGYLVTETLGSPVSLTAPSAGMNTIVYSFTVQGNPESGLIYILENNSSLATAITPLKSFMQADMIDNGMAEFVNVVDPNAPAVTSPSLFDFSTLSTSEVELTGVNVFPNPVKSTATITGVSDIETVEITNITGQRVLYNTTNLETIDMSGLPSGIYFAKIKATSGSKTVKLIKE
ncbi:T9SS type A sorting domain-containing protein [uncultured Kordia sp.]|uniref:T9SS type A sorting domain-containing protein n=1 Tax=uncultured Kordia sp. TaxID=507699 RepID=UPI0026118C55|nr:T9SS type A sorting domain-containing protein [uncultured Kordia sp.]